MGRFNKELHEALENLDGNEFTRGITVGSTLKNFNGIHIISVVTFTATTAESTIVVKDSNGDVVTAESNGTYKLHEEVYTVTNSKAGYFSKTTTIEVEQADITAGTKAVTLDALVKFCAVTFTAKDSVSSDAITGFTLIVKKGEDTVTPIEGVYNLTAATYAYTISKEGYVTQTAVELVISSGDVTTGTKAVEVSLVEAAE
jgi:hypothetical protein